MKNFNRILEDYGVYGYSEISKPILASLITEEPVLLVGEHGTGKTLLAEKLALALGIRTDDANKEFIAYDASKALFEDVVGFPSPESLKKGELEYIESPLTIWNKRFILIDEISRAEPSMQNKWLEVIRSRRIMGKYIPNLQYIFAAMNPLGYLGVNPLDEALADRFFLIVNIPENFKDNDLKKIINSNETKELRQSGELIQLIKNIKNIAENLPEEHAAFIDDFIINFSKKANELGVSFSPRRAAMLKRALTVFFAIDIYEDNLSKKNITENLVKATQYSWNPYVTDDDPQIDKLKEAFYFATKKTTGETKSTIKNFEKYKNNNQRKKTRQNTATQTVNLSGGSTNASGGDEDGDLVSLLKIFGVGAELLTVGFYEMVVKGNSNWESKLEKKL